jgi:hypothetical protein
LPEATTSSSLQAAQRLFELTYECLAAGAAAVGVARMEVGEELRTEHDAFTQPGPGGEEVADDLLGVAVGVGVGGVDDVAAAVEVSARIASAVSALAPQPSSSPKVMVPSESGLTRRPERPSVR